MKLARNSGTQSECFLVVLPFAKARRRRRKQKTGMDGPAAIFFLFFPPLRSYFISLTYLLFPREVASFLTRRHFCNPPHLELFTVILLLYFFLGGKSHHATEENLPSRFISRGVTKKHCYIHWRKRKFPLRPPLPFPEKQH